MALTEFQRSVCRLIAQNRLAGGESYVAGGVALNTLTGANRLSRDVDLFHDTQEALQTSWASDRTLLQASGFTVKALRERPSFVEAEISRAQEAVLMQWAQDSAYRFFPLVQHPELGLTMHPFDLATNKVLALVGRVEVRDWIDIITSHERIQPLGYLAWAACAKDPGFSPASILEQAGRSAHYTQDDIRSLAFDGTPPDVARLSRQWHAMLDDARMIVDILPVDQAGKAVLSSSGDLFLDSAELLKKNLEAGTLRFHSGRIRGAFPSLT